ncbi:MAG TPA: IS200/IS605 family transposase [Flavisolibacter sp.]|nr:IS200/IS605 family transposase [Flavisolibacter sp.]
MANSYTQLHIQFVWAVKYRAALIQNEWKERLHQYITGIFQANNHKMLQVNSMPDHIHIFIGMRPHQSISSLIQNLLFFYPSNVPPEHLIPNTLSRQLS